MTTSVSLSPHDHQAVSAMLVQAGLPFEDLTPAAMELFLGAREQGALVGIVGLEKHGTFGLLRSLAVTPSHRGRGIAQQLVTAQESQARTLGVQRLVLLTETAADFFRVRGYKDTARRELPADVLATPKFRSLCPASAACLSKSL